MHDINFFSPYRIAKARSVDRTLILVSGLVLLGLIAALCAWLVNAQLQSIQRDIDGINGFLSSPVTSQKIEEVHTAKNEVNLLEQYLGAVVGARQDIAAKHSIDPTVLQLVEKRIPAATTLVGLTVDADILTLECRSPVATDPMDFLHAMNASGSFSRVDIVSISTDQFGFNVFTLTCYLKGGAQS